MRGWPPSTVASVLLETPPPGAATDDRTNRGRPPAARPSRVKVPAPPGVNEYVASQGRARQAPAGHVIQGKIGNDDAHLITAGMKKRAHLKLVWRTPDGTCSLLVNIDYCGLADRRVQPCLHP